MRLFDAVERNTAMFASANGGKYKPKPIPQRVTAVDRARERKRRAEGDRLFAIFTTPRREK